MDGIDVLVNIELSLALSLALSVEKGVRLRHSCIRTYVNMLYIQVSKYAANTQ